MHMPAWVIELIHMIFEAIGSLPGEPTTLSVGAGAAPRPRSRRSG
jgi:hypothetical protein